MNAEVKAVAVQATQAAQSGIVSVPKFADGRTRDWSMFMFFRLLPNREVALLRRILGNMLGAMGSGSVAEVKAATLAAAHSLANPAVIHEGGEAAQKPDDTASRCDRYLDWLKLLVNSDAGPLLAHLRNLVGAPQGETGQDAGATQQLAALYMKLPDMLAAMRTALAAMPPVALQDEHQRAQLLQQLQAVFGAATGGQMTLAHLQAALAGALNDTSGKGRESLLGALKMIEASDGAAGIRMLSGGLPTMVLFEVLRQAIVGEFTHPGSQTGMVRGIGEEGVARHDPNNPEPVRWLGAPVSIAFTYTGLTALKLDATTLKSFPDVFKEGMAARAFRLGDTGPAAPENWHGELGKKSVHGYFSGSFQIGSDKLRPKETHWRQLRRDIDAFNSADNGWGATMRLLFRGLFALLGMEIVHIELGQDPYRVDDEGNVLPLGQRFEHFGFADGISQPFVNMKLDTPKAGGGTPRRNGTWSPVAGGEIFLGMRDEDDTEHRQPANPTLRGGGTYMVFRKLEQDVTAFREFLARHEPEKGGSEKLAAQMMGRWRNGSPLVLAPNAPIIFEDAHDPRLNDYRYESDPEGKICPIGSHARRANPRDTNGSDDIRRHRILRRSMSYGGALLDDETPDDGEKRGLLFVCANSRIDLQFEVVQGLWLNKGEFAGQAGMGRCPIVGANDGVITDQFYRSGDPAPVSGLPRFVVTRGGDYFFAPSVVALRAMAAGDSFATNIGDLPFDGAAIADIPEQGLFSMQRMVRYVRMFASGKVKHIRVKMPAAPAQMHGNAITELQPGITSDYVFLGKHALVREVLRSEAVDADGNAVFDVAHHRAASRSMFHGGDILVATQSNIGDGDKRKRMLEIANGAWLRLDRELKQAGQGGAFGALQRIVATQIDETIRRSASVGKIDLIRDLGADTIYAVTSQLFGCKGPDYLTEMAIAAPFSRRHAGELYPDWLTTLPKARPENPGQLSIQLWSLFTILVFSVNPAARRELEELAIQASSELDRHLGQLIRTARTQQGGAVANYLQALVAEEQNIVSQYCATGYTVDDYWREAQLVLAEVIATPNAIVAPILGRMLKTVFDAKIDLGALLPLLLSKPAFNDPEVGYALTGVQRLVYELSRLTPTLPVITRNCRSDFQLKDGPLIKAGDWVGCLMNAANLDKDAFPDPLSFSLYPWLPGPKRKYENYLLFGGADSPRKCWGQDKIALYLLEEFIKAAARLQGLSPLAGPAGELETLGDGGLPIGLRAKFNSVLPPWR